MAGSEESSPQTLGGALWESVDRHHLGRVGEPWQQRRLNSRIQPHLRLSTQISDMFASRTSGVEIGAIGAMLEIQTRGQHAGAHRPEHPSVGVEQSPGEDPAVDRFENRFARSRDGVEFRGEPSCDNPEFGVVYHCCYHRNPEVRREFEKVTLQS